REEELQVAQVRRPAERARQAAADQYPEDQRRSGRARDPARLAEEPHQLALPEGEDGHHEYSRLPVRWRKTSSNVGRATVTASTRPGSASISRATRACPR